MSTIFVTGSGTGIGKTFVIERLTTELITAGVRVRALKPIETGCDPLSADASDNARLLRAQQLGADPADSDRVTRWRFAAPLAPAMAAAREQRLIPFRELIDFCAPEPGGVTLIEGVGGVMVPIDPQHTVLDWIDALAAPVLLVAGSYLGTLSHTLTAVEALRARGCTLAAVIVSESADQPAPAAETTAVLERFLAPLPIALLPRSRKTGAAPAPELLPLIRRFLR